MCATDAVGFYEHIAVFARVSCGQRWIQSRHLRAMNTGFFARSPTFSVTGTAQGMVVFGGCCCIARDLVTMSTITIFTIIIIIVIIFNNVLMCAFTVVVITTRISLGVTVRVADFTIFVTVRD